jgi:3-methylfumaryl-CoA hydratase
VKFGRRVYHSDAIPEFWHLFLFHPHFYESQLRTDGTELGEHSPIIPPALAGTTERMWASGSLSWALDNPLRVGDEVEQVTTIDSIEEKEGREGRGPMFFVWQRKELKNARGLALTEKRCHVFREPAKTDSSSVMKKGGLCVCPHASHVELREAEFTHRGPETSLEGF